MRDTTTDLAKDETTTSAVWLHVDGGASAWLPAGRSIVAGAGRDVELTVTDPTASRRHARFANEGRGVRVTDLGSKNGLRVGGVRVESALVGAGVVVELGRARVRVEGAGASAVAPSSADEPCLPGLIGESSVMRGLARDVRRAARLRLPVLLRGDSGTGKELVARAVHDESPRAKRPFVSLNAAAISRELAESELFGHARGAFTGAVRDRKGAFREAHGGTLFLDEIGALSIELQAKLLRAVEEDAVRPLGAEASMPVDVRLVAATCEPIEAMVAQRRFRADLYERLAVCVLRVPRLADRLDDLPALARHLLRASDLGERSLASSAIAALRCHRWPGNVRELRNVLVQAALRSGGRIEGADVAAVLADRTVDRRRVAPADALRLFEEVGGNISAAARRAEVPRSTMRDLLRAAGAATKSG